MNAARRHNADLINSVTDAAVSPLNPSRGLLPEKFRMALPGASAVYAVRAKRLTLEIARAAGMPFPEEYGRLSSGGLTASGAKPEFPVIHKIANPDRATVAIQPTFRVALAHYREELETLLSVAEEHGRDALIQQCIRGRAINAYLSAIEGRVAAMHGYISRRCTLQVGIAPEVVRIRDDVRRYTADLIAVLKLVRCKPTCSF